MKTNAVEKYDEQVSCFVVVLDSTLPFQVPGVASLLSMCLHTWVLVSFFLCRLSLFSANFNFMLSEFSQLETENRAEKMFTASHILLKKVHLHLDSSETSAVKIQQMYAKHVQTMVFNPKMM